MKKFFSYIIPIFLSFTILNAQPLDGIKICIDPGHGGYNPANDRFIEETGFWESLSNWRKAQHLETMLDSLGANVIVTRDGNEDSDDISLSQRAAIANNNNVDYFHSIHSNGFQGQSNYSLMLFKGTDNNPAFPQAKQMGSIVGTDIHNVNRTTANYNRGDESFLGFNLGVLNPLSMPGVLSEGSFHDYIPESWRLLNGAYKQHEARAIARAVMQYFDAGTLPKGGIAGILRDPEEDFGYYNLPGSADGRDWRKPVNGIKVTILETGQIYNGDINNNGFYFFDELEPGDYTLVFEAENYAADTVTATVQADKSVFKDLILALEPNYDPPQVVEFSPDSSENGVSLLTDIELYFDIRMDELLTEEAFSITPFTSGTFDWSNDRKILYFIPDQALMPGTEYSILLANSAQSYFGTNMSEDFSFSFTTRSKFNLLSAYPADNDTAISKSVEVRIKFDAPVQQSTTPGNVAFKDADGNAVSLTVNFAAFAEGMIVFTPTNELEPNTEYVITLGSGLGDTEGLFLEENYEINFVTESETYVSGNVFDDFENIDTWWQPEQSGSTQGVDVDVTSFTQSNAYSYNGNSSGKLEYMFTGDNGVCRVYNEAKPNIGDINGLNFGMWVYGDLSYNVLEYWFYHSGSSNFRVVVDTLDWTGWKMMDVDVVGNGISGNILFHSIVVVQTPEGSAEGELYFDDAQTNVLVGLDESSEIVKPESYSLAQNFPNPFNPSTTIKFSLPEQAKVSIIIYNALGQQVRSLIVDEEFSSGIYAKVWNGKNDLGLRVPSGVYFYRISTDSFSDTKKMVLLK